MPSVHACVHVYLAHFYINLYISFNYEEIFTKFAENIYVSENKSVKILSSFLKNNMAAIADCSEIINVF